MSQLSNKQKKEWAKLVYTREGLNQKETAKKVGVSTKTMNHWVDEGGWDKLKASLSISKEEQLRDIYAQINELNSLIRNRPEGERYPDSKEADILNKLTSAAKDLEKDFAISDVIDVFMAFNNWLRTLDLLKAQSVIQLQDEYIKTLLLK